MLVIFHLILNSLLVFVALSILVEAALLVFKVRSSRLRYLCRFLPIVKLPFDFLVFTFLGENFFLNLNPFSCEIFFQEFLVKAFPALKGGDLYYIAIPQYLSTWIPELLLKAFVLGSVALLMGFLIKKALEFIHSRQVLKKLFETSSPCNRIIQNETLQQGLCAAKAVLLLCPHIHVPFVAHPKRIFLPTDLVAVLSHDEFEAVVAHELGHLQWKDPLFRLIAHVFGAVFWWIPMGRLIGRLEADQECASDSSIYRYGIDGQSLGNAFVKIVRQAKFTQLKMASTCSFASSEQGHLQRLESILNYRRARSDKFRNYSCFALCCLFFLSFWMC